MSSCAVSDSDVTTRLAAARGGTTGGAVFWRILVPVDGSEGSRQALAAAAQLAARDGAALALLAVVDVRLTYALEAGISPHDLMTSLRREARAMLVEASLTLPPDLHPTEVLREGVPPSEIVAAAATWPADLIVLGRAHHNGLGRLFAAGAADAVAQHAPCPVLVVRAAPMASGGHVWDWRRLTRRDPVEKQTGSPSRAPA